MLIGFSSEVRKLLILNIGLFPEEDDYRLDMLCKK